MTPRTSYSLEDGLSASIGFWFGLCFRRWWDFGDVRECKQNFVTGYVITSSGQLSRVGESQKGGKLGKFIMFFI